MSQIYIFQSPIGCLKLCAEDGKLIEVSHVPGELPTGGEPPVGVLGEAYTQLMEYFAGERRQFELPIDCSRGTIFQQRVWAALREIPYGETRSYAELAQAVERPKGAQAVGQANKKNPLLIINPCHRVIQKDGGIGGFACGLQVKNYLLELERREPLRC